MNKTRLVSSPPVPTLLRRPRPVKHWNPTDFGILWKFAPVLLRPRKFSTSVVQCCQRWVLRSLYVTRVKRRWWWMLLLKARVSMAILCWCSGRGNRLCTKPSIRPPWLERNKEGRNKVALITHDVCFVCVTLPAWRSVSSLYRFACCLPLCGFWVLQVWQFIFLSSIIFQHEIVGEFWYKLNLVAEQPEAKYLPVIDCDLGR